MKLRDAIAAAAARIGGDSPRQDAEILLAQLLGIGRGALFARLGEPLLPTDAQAFDALVARRARGEPVAYLTGERGFWTLTLRVSPAVLVPRPETELLVEWGLALLPPNGCAPPPRIVDLGTGSGAIALALASERADAQVEAIEASPAALEVARDNAQALGLMRVAMRQGHWCAPLAPAAYDLVVSNPPYIALGDPHLAALRHEPAEALTDGGDGLQALREIAATAPAHLRPGGWLLLEHGYAQGPAVRALLAQAGLVEIETRRDYGGQERATGGRRPA